MNVSGHLLAVFAAPTGIFDLISSAIELFKFLKGELPKSVKKAENGGMIVENNEGEITQVNGDTFNILINTNAGAAVEKFVKRSLRLKGDKLSIEHKGEPIAEVANDDARSFKSLPQGEKLTENETDMVVRIASPSLEGSARWKFNEGRGMFSATIADEEFLDLVKNGQERFGAGDVLRFRMTCIQRVEKNKPKAE
ncbi:MAG: hypothetical protein VW405_04550 [Rhodospirillaceae bacterium]